MENFHSLLQKLDGEIRIVMEATGIYHLPVLTFFHNKGYFVSVVNPFAMKKYAKDNSIRGAKTDKLDSVMIANYGIDKWFRLQRYEGEEETYAELKLLGRRYRYYMELHVKALQELTHILDYVAPGLKKMFNSWNKANGKDKLSDFAERFWHFEQVLAKSLPEYSTVREMGGVGDVLAVKLIAEIGDVRRIHSAKALIAWTGIDPPPYESGQFIGSRRKITKRGSSTLRKVGYEVMRVLKRHPAPEDDAVYNYILKKEGEGKSKKHAKIAGLNKFLRIYYARVIAVYHQ